MERADASSLLKELKSYCSYEDIASRLGRCFNTVYGWRTGLKRPCQGDFELMSRMLGVYKAGQLHEK